jgi:hypothetical protein
MDEDPYLSLLARSLDTLRPQNEQLTVSVVFYLTPHVFTSLALFGSLGWEQLDRVLSQPRMLRIKHVHVLHEDYTLGGFKPPPARELLPNAYAMGLPLTSEYLRTSDILRILHSPPP